MDPETQTCPEEILGWIAWYPDRGLSDAQRGAVEAHAATCAACRAEIASLAGGDEAETPAEPDANEAARAERIWSAVSRRIEGEPVRASAPPPARRETAPRRPAGPAALRLAATLALALACGALGALVATRFGAAPPPVYRTATETAAPETGPRLQVVFREDARFGDVQRALREVGGRVTDGPSPLGVWQVALSADTDPTQAAAALRASVATLAEVVER